MALAWKAGWVHALTSSNLVSSAMISVYARVNYLTLTYTLFVLAARIERLQPRCEVKSQIMV